MSSKPWDSLLSSWAVPSIKVFPGQLRHIIIHLNLLYIGSPNAEVQNFLAERLDDLLVKHVFQCN